MLEIPSCDGGPLPTQGSARVRLSELIGFSFAKANDLTEPAIDADMYGLLMRVQSRAISAITSKLLDCLNNNGITFNTIVGEAKNAAEYTPNIQYNMPAGTVRKGILIRRRHDCTSGLGAERMIVKKITIYLAASQQNLTNVPLYYETNGIISSVTLPQLIGGGVANVFSTESINPIYKLSAPFVSQGNSINFSLDANISTQTVRPLCPTCPHTQGCFKASGLTVTNNGDYIENTTSGFGIIPCISCACDSDSIICAYAHLETVRNIFIYQMSIELLKEQLHSPQLSNFTTFQGQGENYDQKLKDLESSLDTQWRPFCNSIKQTVQSMGDMRCLSCNGSRIVTLI